MMRNPILPVLTVLTVVAGAAGLQLGETTIAQIDPLYFQGAAPTARDVSRAQTEPRRNDFAAASGWEQGYADRAADCGADCGPRQASFADAALAPYSDPTIEPRWATSSPDELIEEDFPRERVVRAARESSRAGRDSLDVDGPEGM